MHAAPLLYVCAVSDFTLPIYEACLNLRPQRLLLIVSKNFTAAADRLQTLLREELPDCELVRLGHDAGTAPLHGDELVSDWQWIRQQLCPQLAQAQAEGWQRALNITGGTKAFVLALHRCHPWTRIDYVPHGAGLQSYGFVTDASGQPAFITTANGLDGQQWQTITALALARLYNNDITPWQANDLDRAAIELGLAQQIWDGQQRKDEALRLLFACLAGIWSSRSARYQPQQLTLSWEEFFAAGSAADWQDARARCLCWLERLQALRPADAAATALLSWDDECIRLPGNKARRTGKAWRDWVSGGWLEQAAHDWLLADGLPTAAVARNIRAGGDRSTSSTMREADILVHHQHRSALIEIKAGLPSGSTPASFEQQLSSLGDRFGRNRKALLFGPLLRQQLQAASRLQDFELRCKENGVHLLYDRHSLLAFVHGRKLPSQPPAEPPAQPSSSSAQTTSPITENT